MTKKKILIIIQELCVLVAAFSSNDTTKLNIA